MTKQEKIREGIALEFFNLRCGECRDWDKCFDTHKFCETLYDRVDSHLSYLHSQGVVIKAEGETLYCSYADPMAYTKPPKEFCPFIKAGYVAVEPLVVKDG